MDSSTEISDSSTEELNNSTEQSANKSIVKKSRVKKSKEDKRINDGSDEPKNYSSDDQVLFTAFTEWIHKHAPTVGKMEEPFSIDQYLKLKKKGFTREQTQAYLIKMHNYKPLTKKNRSAYLTLLNWDRMQKDRDGGNNQNNKESAEKSMVI
jgi:phage FluMu protein gp41